MVNGNIVRKIRKKVVLTQEQLARKSCCATNTIGRIERGQLQPGKVLEQRLAQALGVPASALEDSRGSDAPAAAGSDQHLRNALQLLGQMTAEELASLSPIVHALADTGQSPRTDTEKPDSQPQHSPGENVPPRGFDIFDVEQLPKQWAGKFLPIIGRLAAGKGFDTSEAEAYPAGVAYLYLRYLGAPKNAFALNVEGQSMARRFRHGDMVIVDPDQPADSGVCVVLTDDGTGQRIARLKRLSLQGQTAKLESLNPEYPPISMPAGRVQAYRIWRHLSLGTAHRVGSQGYRWE